MPRLETGQSAPPFTLPDHAGRPVSLSDFAGHNLIIFFYPAAMTPGCTREACDFRDSLVSLQQAGYDVVGISPDKPDKLATFAQKESLTYPCSRTPTGPSWMPMGHMARRCSMERRSTGVIRSTIVIGPDGKVPCRSTTSRPPVTSPP